MRFARLSKFLPSSLPVQASKEQGKQHTLILTLLFRLLRSIGRPGRCSQSQTNFWRMLAGSQQAADATNLLLSPGGSSCWRVFFFFLVSIYPLHLIAFFSLSTSKNFSKLLVEEKFDAKQEKKVSYGEGCWFVLVWVSQTRE